MHHTMLGTAAVSERYLLAHTGTDFGIHHVSNGVVNYNGLIIA